MVDGKSHSLVAWLATTERGQLILFCCCCSIQRSSYQRSDLFHSVGLVLGFNEDKKMHQVRRKQRLWTQGWISLQSPRVASAAHTFSPFHTHITLSTPNMHSLGKGLLVLLGKHPAQHKLCCGHHCCTERSVNDWPAALAFTSFMRDAIQRAKPL